MSEFSNLLSNNTVTKDLANNVQTRSFGRVSRANEKENVCDIIYENSAGKVDRVANVEVEIRTKKDDWFPKVGELVKTTETNDNQPMIIGKLIRDYAQDIKPDRYLKKDTMATTNCAVRNNVD